MKTFNKDYLPETISYNNETYYNNTDVKYTLEIGKELSDTKLETINTNLKKEGRKMVIVKVLSKNLRGKTDFHGQLYKPTVWIFTTKPAN